MKKIILKASWALIALTTPVAAVAHPGHSIESAHGLIHFEHIFVALTVVFFIVINNLIKKYLEVKIDK